MSDTAYRNFPAAAGGHAARSKDLRPLLEPGRNCWRIERAERASLIVDAADYYHHARTAMLHARTQVLLIGWDFDTRIFLDRQKPTDGAPENLGPFVSWLAHHRPELRVHILKWDWGAVKLLGRGTTILRLARWWLSHRISFKLDGAHPTGASHHQKILVIDDTLAFCGGIDMTGSRWDTRAHRDDDPRRKRPTTGRHYCPWHDATMAVDGEAARALGELGRNRWQAASGERLPRPAPCATAWPEDLEPQFRDVMIGIARTQGAHADQQEVRENEALFRDIIGSARRFIYAESQYFASRVIAEALAERLAEPDGPDVVIVNPSSADGWLQEEVMGSARAELLAVLHKADRHGRFRIYTPVTEHGEPIYVHAKILIADDRILRVGSSNMNNRSMGLDSECDLVIDAALEGNRGCEERIAALRTSLLAEHLGVEAEDVEASFARTGSLVEAVERLRGDGRSLHPFVPEEPNALERKLARSEALDPECGGPLFEPRTRSGLLSHLRRFTARAAR